MKKRVLLIEDDPALASGIVRYLELNDIVCDHCFDGVQALRHIDDNVYDVVVSDVNMPRMNGFEVCRQLRSRGSDLPILMLTSRDHIDDKTQGFESGADDYLIKPFEQKELLLRISALANRKSGQSKSLNISELSIEIDLLKREVKREGQLIELTKSSWIILEKLAQSWPNPVSKSDLEYALWGDAPPDSNGLKVQVHHLRKRFDKPYSSPLIHAVPGFGFVLKRDQQD